MDYLEDNMAHAHCYDCGLQYGSEAWIEAVIPDKIWNKIKPKDYEDGCGILCITCIARRLSILGFKNVPVWLCGTEPFNVHLYGTKDHIEKLRNWDQEI